MTLSQTRLYCKEGTHFTQLLTILSKSYTTYVPQKRKGSNTVFTSAPKHVKGKHVLTKHSVNMLTISLFRLFVNFKTQMLGFTSVLPVSFSFFSTFVVLHDLSLYCFGIFWFLCFTSLVSLAGFYTEIEPDLVVQSHFQFLRERRAMQCLIRRRH